MNATETEEQIYSKVGGWLCLDFTNTTQGYTLHTPTYDYLRSYSDLITWARQAELITREEEDGLKRQAEANREKAEEMLERARALRGNINRIFSAIATEQRPEEAAFEALNRDLAEAMSHACIESTDNGDGDSYAWGWSGFPEKMESLLWPVVRSAADLLVNHEKLERVRECNGDSCGWLFVDTSKNHSRRWCDMRDCGNAAKARRHYQRKVMRAIGA